jgi:hypothetical protein
VSVVWLTAPEGTVDPDQRRRRFAAAGRARDVVLLRNGDAVEGVLAGLERDQAVRIEVEKKAVAVPFDKVAAVATESVSTARPKGTFGRLILADGARLSLASAECSDGKTLRGTTLFGAAVRVPLDQVAALDLHQGRAVYLSDLKPSRYEYTPYLDEQHSYVADGSASGGELALGGGVHDKGVGMHAASRLSYDLAGRYRRFEALVGLDDRTGRGGRVRVRVLVDGKERDVGAPKELTWRDGPLPVRVDVAGAKELTLVAECGARGHVEAEVDWADARLITAGKGNSP